MSTTSMNFTTDSKVKERFNLVAQELGLSSSALLNIFVTRVSREGKIPFEVKIVPEKKLDFELDEESKKEMLRTLQIEEGKRKDTDSVVNNVDDYFKNLGE